MQIVIEIDNGIYDICKSVRNLPLDENDIMSSLIMQSIANGTPLPKGHGRLKDVDWIDDNCPDYRTEDGAWCYKWEDIDNAPTIIEADKAESEE